MFIFELFRMKFKIFQKIYKQIAQKNISWYLTFKSMRKF